MKTSPLNTKKHEKLLCFNPKLTWIMRRCCTPIACLKSRERERLSISHSSQGMPEQGFATASPIIEEGVGANSGCLCSPKCSEHVQELTPVLFHLLNTVCVRLALPEQRAQQSLARPSGSWYFRSIVLLHHVGEAAHLIPQEGLRSCCIRQCRHCCASPIHLFADRIYSVSMLSHIHTAVPSLVNK